MTFSLHKLQEEQKPWAAHNFGPDRNPSHTLLGIVEELGELIQPLDQLMDFSEPWSKVAEEIKDSIADLVVFSADYCTGREWDLGSLDTEAALAPLPPSISERGKEESFVDIDWHLRALTIAISCLCHHQLKFNQKIRGSAEDHIRHGKAQMVVVLRTVRSLSAILGFDFLKNVEAVWFEVKKRDWKKDAKTGGGDQPHGHQNV